MIPAILYSFHFYDPWQYTARKANKGRYAYPDKMPAHWNGPAEKWDRDALAKMIDPGGGVGEAAWCSHQPHRGRRVRLRPAGGDGAREYLEDIVTTLNDRGWHWAFYSFREDAWDRMDYEVGPGGLGRCLLGGRRPG